jgi:HEAT repeat protein
VWLGEDGAAIPVLLDLLKDDDESDWDTAFHILGDYHSGSQQPVPALLSMLQHPNSDKRYRAARALCFFRPQKDEAILLLVQALDDGNVAVAYYAAGVLGGMGSQAKPAVPTLVRILKSDRANQGFRLNTSGVGSPFPTTLGRGVATALRQIDPEAAAQSGVN